MTEPIDWLNGYEVVSVKYSVPGSRSTIYPKRLSSKNVDTICRESRFSCVNIVIMPLTVDFPCILSIFYYQNIDHNSLE